MTFDEQPPQLPWLRPEWIAHAGRLVTCFRRWLGKDLIPPQPTPEQTARALFEAPAVIVSHDAGADPLLNYGNRTALSLWEMDIPTLVLTPSRLTAEPVHREERARLLERTTEHGYVDDYAGIRISRSGRRFRIERATVWNLLDEADKLIGQAATFTRWQFL